MAKLLSNSTADKVKQMINDWEGTPVNTAGAGGEFKAVKDLHYARLTIPAIDEISGDPIPNMFEADEVRYDTSSNDWEEDDPGFLYYSETAFVIVIDGEAGDVVSINPIITVDGVMFWLGIKGGSSPTTLLNDFVVVDSETGEYSADIIDNPTDQNVSTEDVVVKTLKATANFDVLTNAGPIFAKTSYQEDDPNSIEVPPAKRKVYYVDPPILY